MDLSQQFDVVKNISAEEFNRKYFKTQTPVVIKDLTHNTVAEERWSFDYFKQTMGDVKVDVFDNRNPKGSASAFTSPDLKMKFSDFLNIIATNEYTHFRIFLFNLFKFNPQLREEYPCPKLFKGVLDKVGHMFFGGKDTKVRIHYDVDMSNVLLTHFGGRKRIQLFAPEYKKLLYCLPLNTYSLINVDNPDYNKYPALRYVKGYDIMLEHGDSVFMPSGYWHYITYVEGGFSVSYRKVAPTFRKKIEGLLNFGVMIPADKLLNKVLGNKWLEAKKQIAEKRADKILLEHYSQEFNQLSGI
jgi:hypothetical protein